MATLTRETPETFPIGMTSSFTKVSAFNAVSKAANSQAGRSKESQLPVP